MDGYHGKTKIELTSKRKFKMKSILYWHPNIYNFLVRLMYKTSFNERYTTINNLITVFEKPSAAFYINIHSGCLPLEVSLNDMSSSSSRIIGWQWDFGDGGNSTSG